MKNWKYGANPKKVKYARRKAQPGWRKARTNGIVFHERDSEKPCNNPTRMLGTYRR